MGAETNTSSKANKVVKLPKAVLSGAEVMLTPQQRLVETIDRFERGYMEWQQNHRYKQSVTSRESRDWGECNIIPDFLCYVANDEAQRKGYEMQARHYQLLDLHEAAGGSRRQAFQHAFNTITIDDQAFLVDLSFSQFLSDDGKLRFGPKWTDVIREASGATADNPLAEELVTNGFVPLTDENLQEYLRITSLADDSTYGGNMTTALLETLQPLPMDLEGREIYPDFGIASKAA